MSTGIVRLNNAVFYAHHGVMQEEHRIGGRYEVDIEMEVDFEKAAQEDELSCTVDYERVYSDVRDIITGNKFFLIERLAYLIAHRILEREVMARTVEVTVRKANPPVGGPCDCAEAVYEACRT
ncbi:MAG: dihydroneopterin aldolase [Bacteroidetes bacterium]|nr:dihydroneopterin aldolase [Bacteroidota bacterium]MDA0875540.1 dihydroneopterin aldolase [Bacteroidota bacterium]